MEPNTSHLVVLALGSNIKDREFYLREAINALASIAITPIQKSRIFETPPVGPGDQEKYLNQCVRFETHINARALLLFCKETERVVGRISRGKWESREIDIDIITFGNELIQEEGLTVPHPLAIERQFVLVPLADLDPDFIVPGHRESVRKKLEACIHKQGKADIVEHRPRGGARQAFPDSIRYICVEGVVGVGKSTLVKYLAERLGCVALLEEFENNPFLSSFYGDKHRYAFQTQLFFFLSRYRQIEETFQQQDLFQSQIVSDYMFAKDRIFAILNLDENEMALYQKLSGLLDKNLAKPDFVVYLQADTKTLIQRIKMRDRPYERTMDESYVDALNQCYNSFFHHYRESPLLIINTNHIDFVRNPKDLDMLVEQIVKVRPGVNFLSQGSGL